MPSVELMNDDGVFVLASAKALRRRFSSGAFDPTFPKELLAGAAAEELCAWQTTSSDDTTLHVQEGTSPPPGARALGVLRLEDGDELLLLPYAQYTMACGRRRGVPEEIAGLSGKCSVAPGRYAVWVGRNPSEDLAFDVTLAPPGAQPTLQREVPQIPA